MFGARHVEREVGGSIYIKVFVENTEAGEGDVCAFTGVKVLAWSDITLVAKSPKKVS